MTSIPRGYRILAQNLEWLCGQPIWITGGWALARHMSRRYAGDVDLITTASPDLIEKSAGIVASRIGRSARGNTRIHLADGNYVDVTCVASFGGARSLSGALSRFTFSANSVAEGVGGQIFSTKTSSADLRQRKWRVNELYRQRAVDQIPNAKQIDALTHFFSLDKSDDRRTSRIVSMRDKCASEFSGAASTSTLSKFAQLVLPYVPSGRDFWLGRGIVRQALLQRVDHWDDLDVFIDSDRVSLYRHLHEIHAPYSINYFGLPKVQMFDGRKADLIPVEGAEGLRAMLMSFPLRLDALAWSPVDQQLVDPTDVVEDIERRVVRTAKPAFDRAAISDQRYYALKSTYLLGKYSFRPGKDVLRIINTARQFTVFDRRNATRLAADLLAHGVTSTTLRRFAFDGEHASRSAIGLLLYYCNA